MGMENYSLSDIRAATENEDGFGGGSWFWIVVLFLFMFGSNGFGGFGNKSGVADNYVLASDFANIERKIDGVNNGLCDGFYAMNTGMLNGFAGVQNTLAQGFAGINTAIVTNGYQTQSQVASMAAQTQQNFCDTNRNIDAVRFENSKNTTEITNAIHCEGEQTRALINANTMQALRDKLEDRDRELLAANFQLSQQSQTSALIDQLRPCARPAYITCSPYTTSNSCGCGCA